jgi:hypothetical protein
MNNTVAVERIWITRGIEIVVRGTSLSRWVEILDWLLKWMFYENLNLGKRVHHELLIGILHL